MRQSTSINRKVTQNAFRAVEFAFSQGQPLTHYLVLNLGHTPGRSQVEVFADVMDRYRNWLSYRRKKSGLPPLPPIYMATHENPDDTHPHVNVLIHVPRSLQREFLKKLPLWLRRARKGDLGPFDVSVNDIADLDEGKQIANYVLKGTDPAFIDHFHLGRLFEKHGPQGVVHGKRVTISPSIGKAARDALGWRSQRRRGFRARPENSNSLNTQV